MHVETVTFDRTRPSPHRFSGLAAAQLTTAPSPWNIAVLTLALLALGCRRSADDVASHENDQPGQQNASLEVPPTDGDTEDTTEGTNGHQNETPLTPPDVDLGPRHESQPDSRTSSNSDADSGKHTNRLAHETSPYLLMHAHNPVDWYPWGEEALEKAKQEDKVIFLSVGYSSCHWCHVMERESFMDKEIAEFLNANFVCIKLDREERPDVDSIYMLACQVVNNGRGGWPLSMFLTPDARPFFGGTYFPARDGDRRGQAGFLTVIKKMAEIWTNSRQKVLDSASQLTDIVTQELRGSAKPADVAFDTETLAGVQAALAAQYDKDYGGFGYNVSDPLMPKFPEPSNLLFLADRVRHTDDAEAREMLEHTLERMSMGGIRDHLGGGFHRYSVDRFWHIPHFEKMLYDNGQLSSVYAEAFEVTNREDFRKVLVEMLDFVIRELTAPEAGFYSALDADSEGEEGKFYRWEQDEITELLSEDDRLIFASVYDFDGEPNFEGEYFVPMLNKPLADIAVSRRTTENELEYRLAPIRSKLMQHRSKRTRPLTDEKVLTGWNGLMIRGLADGGRVLGEEKYILAAQAAAEFILNHLRNEDGRLLRTYAGGQAKLNAYLDDYAFFVDGLLALHRATGDNKWLQEATTLTDKQIELYWDDQAGGFFFTSKDHESLIARGKSLNDGARPSGNSVSATNLVYLARTLPNPKYADQAKRTIQAAGDLLHRSAASAPRLMIAYAELLDPSE